jgi:hypothetical protein
MVNLIATVARPTKNKVAIAVRGYGSHVENADQFAEQGQRPAHLLQHRVLEREIEKHVFVRRAQGIGSVRLGAGRKPSQAHHVDYTDEIRHYLLVSHRNPDFPSVFKNGCIASGETSTFCMHSG